MAESLWRCLIEPEIRRGLVQAHLRSDKARLKRYALRMANLSPLRILQPVAQHWRGTTGLWQAILLNLLGVTLLLNFVLAQVSNQPEWLILVLLVVSSALVPIWQSVGLIRACSLHLRERGDNVLPWVGYATLLIVLLMTASQTVGTVLGLERFRAEPEPFVVAEPLPMSEDGSTAQIAGVIDYAMLSAFQEAVKAHPQLHRVHLESEGGLIYAARVMANLILAQGLETEVSTTCNSACTLIFAAGSRRVLGKQGRLGFHSYGRPSQFHMLMADTVVEQQKDADYLRARGVTEDFLQDVYQADSSSIWYPDRARLQAAGFLTD